MVRGLGIDLVEISRIRDMLERHGERFVHRVFTPGEVAYCRGHADPAPSFAARFAAKEAALKVLGTGLAEGIRWQDVEVRGDARGAPSIALAGLARDRALALGIDRMLVSLSHDGGHAVAAVVGEG